MKWDQWVYTFLIVGACWSELAELFPGWWSAKCFRGFMILVLWFKDCYFMVTIFISLHNQNVEIFRLNSTIQKLNSSCVGRRDTIWNYLDFVAIFVAFASSWWFYTDCNFSFTRPCDMNNSLQSNTTFSCSIIPLYCNWKSITSMWCEN